jgi:hypothetical protein
MKTAVEWLHIEFQKRFPKETNEMYNNNQFDYEDMIIKAKEMEKQQIVNAFNEGIQEMIGRNNSHIICKHSDISAEQYYEQTFKSE